MTNDNTVIYLDARAGTSPLDSEDYRQHVAGLVSAAGYSFIYLPDLLERISPEMMQYYFPGAEGAVSAKDASRRILDLAGQEADAGFLYRRDGQESFREISEAEGVESIENFLSSLLDRSLSDYAEPESENIYYQYFTEESSEIRFSVACERADLPRHFDRQEEALDPRTKSIIEAWEKISREYNVSFEELEVILGYTVKLSRLNITVDGRIILTDFGGREVKVNDLTKAVYFFYLKHPEGAAIKELPEYEEEILKYYMRVTGRDDVDEIRRSVHNNLDPFGNNINVCLSRIKKAFKDIVSDRVAQFYYVDGSYGQRRFVRLDRDLVIWEH